MRWAVDHSFADDLRPAGAETLRRFTQRGSDVGRSIWSWPELGHGNNVLPLFGSEPIKSHFKKTVIQAPGRFIRHLRCVRNFNPFALRNIPALVAPFLKEVWIPLGLEQYLVQGVFAYAV